MSAFYARSAFKFLELLLWSMIVRLSRINSVYNSRLVRLKCWKSCDRQIETCKSGGTMSRRLVRLKCRANEIDRLKGLGSEPGGNFSRRLVRLKRRANEIDRLKGLGSESGATFS